MDGSNDKFCTGGELLSNYIVTDTELTAVADAIRTKGGTSALIPWQAGTGFADAIGAIPSGGGITPTGTKQISITQNGTTTEDVTQYANAEITVNVPSGASLPSVISKIDGGSFTLASDTDCQNYDISHSLGVVPKEFVVWTEDITIGVAQSAIFLVRIDYFDTPYSATTESSNLTMRIGTNGAAVPGGAGITATNVPDWVTASKICANYNTNYKAGCVYKWLAWA